MWVINNDKERAKIYLRNDIESSVTNITDASNKINEAIASINRAASGMASGKDKQLMDECKRAERQLSLALQNLNACRSYVNQLDTREWIEDEQR